MCKYIPSLLSPQIPVPDRALPPRHRTVTSVPQLSQVLGLIFGNIRRPGEQSISLYWFSPPFLSRPRAVISLLYFGTFSSPGDEPAGLQMVWGGTGHNLPRSTIYPFCCTCKLRALIVRAILLPFTALYFMLVYHWWFCHYLRNTALENLSA